MLDRQGAYCSIAVWVGGLLLLLGIDFALRAVREIPYGLGMPEFVWFASQIVLAIASLSLLLRAVKNVRLLPSLGVVLIAALLGGAIYVATLWLYIIGTGVDSV